MYHNFVGRDIVMYCSNQFMPAIGLDFFPESFNPNSLSLSAGGCRARSGGTQLDCGETAEDQERETTPLNTLPAAAPPAPWTVSIDTVLPTQPVPPPPPPLLATPHPLSTGISLPLSVLSLSSFPPLSLFSLPLHLGPFRRRIDLLVT